MGLLLQKEQRVKIHTKLVVCDPSTVYPENIVCSTRDVGDKEVALIW